MKRVVRKRLDDDCLLDGQLHPSIAERLQRVRELALSNVANLQSVQRDDDGVWLAWEYVPGVSLEEFISQPHEELERARVARDLRRTVSALHAQGIVHGALHPRNVVIDLHGKVYLTHVSPLLWSDTAEDERALNRLLSQLGDSPTYVSKAVADEDRSELRTRRVAYALSAAAVAAGFLIFAGILWYIRA